MKRGITGKPQRLNAHNWYYENRVSIDVIHEVREITGEYIRTDTIRIPIRKLQASIQRMRGGAIMGRVSPKKRASHAI